MTVATAPDREQQRRRNLWLALIHLLIAIGFLAAFVWTTVQR